MGCILFIWQTDSRWVSEKKSHTNSHSPFTQPAIRLHVHYRPLLLLSLLSPSISHSPFHRLIFRRIRLQFLGFLSPSSPLPPDSCWHHLHQRCNEWEAREEGDDDDDGGSSSCSSHHSLFMCHPHTHMHRTHIMHSFTAFTSLPFSSSSPAAAVIVFVPGSKRTDISAAGAIFWDHFLLRLCLLSFLPPLLSCRWLRAFKRRQRHGMGGKRG